MGTGIKAPYGNSSTSTLRLPCNHLVDSDEDETEHSSRYAEDPPTMSSETTCLLYDARLQQEERERYLQEADSESGRAQSHSGTRSGDRSAAKNSSPAPKSRESSLIKRPTGEAAVQLRPEHSTQQGISPSRIQFNDSVRISGGIRSKRGRRRLSASSIFTPPPHAVERSSNTGETSETFEPDHSPPPQHVQIGTPRGSFSRNSGRISRAASFLSEDGTAAGRSRASTPASIYAPLLLPSKTAPSPSRHFYLTFKREDGQATYRELVRQQTDRKRKRNARWQGRTRDKHLSHIYSQNNRNDMDETAGSDEDSDDGGYCGSGCCSDLAFWTCGISRLIRRRSSQKPGSSEDRSDFDRDLDNHDAPSIDTDSLETGNDSDFVSNGRQERKSEMQAIFGRRPWRYLKSGYWMYRFRGFHSREIADPDESC